MSVESAKKFLQEKVIDSETAQKVQSSSSPREEIVAMASRDGYDFTYLELIDALKSVRDEELDLKELDSAAGGGFGDFCGQLFSLCGIIV